MGRDNYSSFSGQGRKNGFTGGKPGRGRILREAASRRKYLLWLGFWPRRGESAGLASNMASRAHALVQNPHNADAGYARAVNNDVGTDQIKQDASAACRRVADRVAGCG